LRVPTRKKQHQSHVQPDIPVLHAAQKSTIVLTPHANMEALVPALPAATRANALLDIKENIVKERPPQHQPVIVQAHLVKTGQRVKIKRIVTSANVLLDTLALNVKNRMTIVLTPHANMEALVPALPAATRANAQLDIKENVVTRRPQHQPTIVLAHHARTVHLVKMKPTVTNANVLLDILVHSVISTADQPTIVLARHA